MVNMCRHVAFDLGWDVAQSVRPDTACHALIDHEAYLRQNIGEGTIFVIAMRMSPSLLPKSPPVKVTTQSGWTEVHPG